MSANHPNCAKNLRCLVLAGTCHLYMSHAKSLLAGGDCGEIKVLENKVG